jgi:hypothetical protein
VAKAALAVFKPSVDPVTEVSFGKKEQSDGAPSPCYKYIVCLLDSNVNQSLE